MYTHTHRIVSMFTACSNVPASICTVKQGRYFQKIFKYTIYMGTCWKHSVTSTYCTVCNAGQQRACNNVPESETS